MAHGEASVLIRRPAKEILDFVMDLQRYREVDDKIGPIRWLQREGDTVTFRFRPRLLGLPGPSTTQRVVRTGDERIDITPVPSWQDRILRFKGTFTCADHPDGTVVTRRLDFDFSRPLAVALDSVVTRWLGGDVPRELAAVKARLEG
ncbi:SRPBCC family protein [Streptosporangium sp. 'caverna']|uniref:SRPBCC family protein n=1 Tax=Streptosporangium sp. 'caverna' TaxID=2202249 RepID=UPI000D7D85DC|nr:SRPBCC family protein [Streptosporangium sp. 'caverna']AWS43919.1 hypothetical protein DKM19_23770 [Streptosporangium sp. 'caverna']